MLSRNRIRPIGLGTRPLVRPAEPLAVHAERSLDANLDAGHEIRHDTTRRRQESIQLEAVHLAVELVPANRPCRFGREGCQGRRRPTR